MPTIVLKWPDEAEDLIAVEAEQMGRYWYTPILAPMKATLFDGDPSTPPDVRQIRWKPSYYRVKAGEQSVLVYEIDDMVR